VKTYDIIFTAGQVIPLQIGGNLFYLLDTAAPVSIDFTQNQSIQATAQGVEQGFWDSPAGGFQGLILSSATAQTIKVGIGSGTGGYQRISGAVSLTGQQGVFTQTQATVTNANLQILAANAARKSLLIQNNDAAATMRVTVDGTAATATKGFRVVAGAMLDLTAFNPASAINAFMETAGSGANNIDIAEG